MRIGRHLPRNFIPVLASIALLGNVGTARPATPPAADVTIDATEVYPESVTSTRDGGLFVGSMRGVIYHAAPGAKLARAWVQPDAQNGLQSVFGVLADEKSHTLWVCSVPNPFQPPAAERPAELVALDLVSGKLKSRHAFPGPRSVCNDVTIAADGAAYAADTQNGRILKLAKGANELQPFGESEQLKGIDGIAFAADGTLYANIVTRGVLLRVGITRAGQMGALTELQLDEKLGGPDGMRLIDGSRFLLAEGTSGRISEVRIEGDRATLRPLRTGLNSSPGVTPVGNTAYAIEGKIGYLVDPALRGKDPGPFRILAIPMNQPGSGK
jgi:sugar lactone lactonase YvrE